MQGMKQISMIVASVALALSGQVFAETSPEAGNIKGDAAKAINKAIWELAVH